MALRLRRHLTAGLLVVVPLVLTGFVLVFVWNLLVSWTQPLAPHLWNREIPGLGIGLTLVLLYVVGLLSANLAGKKALELFGRVLENLPLVKTVYTAATQLVQAVSPGNRQAFRRVVLVEFPRKGAFALAFVTGEQFGSAAQPVVPVYVPTAINPASGFVLLLPEADIVETSLSVEEGVKLVVSGGVVCPSGPLSEALQSRSGAA
jgi:uncharacterized membrane protein